MANQYVNKVIIGTEVKLDLTQDDITADKLAEGVKAHDRTGAPIVGTSTKDADTTDATAAAAEILKDNVTVKKIPQYIVSNDAGGATLIMGDEYFG